MKRIKAGVIVVVVLFIAASVSAGVKDGQCPEGSNPTDKNASRFTNSIGMEFVKIPSGKGRLSKDKWDVNDSYREVEFLDGFYMQATEVTQRQYKKVMGKDPSRFKHRRDDYPVENVSMKDTEEFIRRLNELEGTTEYRLPTADEWEYACRAGTKTRFYTGDCITASQGNIGFAYREYPHVMAVLCPGGKDSRLGRPQPVKCYSPNPWGLYDMLGNIGERVSDPCKSCNGVVMGGSYFASVAHNYSAYCTDSIMKSEYLTGFRVVAGAGVTPKPYPGDPEPYADAYPDSMWARGKKMILKRFFSHARFGKPEVRPIGKGAKEVAFIEALAEDFITQKDIEHIEPLFVAESIDDPRFDPYKAMNPTVRMNELYTYDSNSEPIIATRDLALFEFDVDNNPDNGDEIIVFGTDFERSNGCQESGSWYQVFLRKKLRCLSQYRSRTGWKFDETWPEKNELHGWLRYKGRLLFWRVRWFETEKQFVMSLHVEKYAQGSNYSEQFGTVRWVKRKAKGAE